MALEFDLACQFALNRYDLQIEKMRLSVWGVPEDTNPETKVPAKSQASPNAFKTRKQTMTAKDIMRNYR